MESEGLVETLSTEQTCSLKNFLPICGRTREKHDIELFKDEKN